MHQSLPEHKRRRYPRCDRCRHARRGCDGYARGTHASNPSGSSRPISCSRCIRLKTTCSFETLGKIPPPGMPLAISSSALRSLHPQNAPKDQGWFPGFNGGFQIDMSYDALPDPDSCFTLDQTIPDWPLPMDEREQSDPTDTFRASDIGLLGITENDAAAGVSQLFGSIHDDGFLPFTGMGLDPSIVASFPSVDQTPKPNAADPIRPTEDISSLEFSKIELQFDPIDSNEPQVVSIEDQQDTTPEPDSFPPALNMRNLLFASSFGGMQEECSEQPRTNLVLRQAASPQTNRRGPLDFCSLSCVSEDCPWRLGNQNKGESSNPIKTTKPRSSKRPFGNSRKSPPVSLNDIVLGQSNNKTMVISLLMQVYRGAMENSLRCWSNRHSCPWEKPDAEPGPLDFLTQPTENLLEMSLYARAHMLDHAFSRFRKTPLTAEQNAGATKALKLSMLAFASQWRRSPLDTPNYQNARPASNRQNLGVYDDVESVQFEDRLRTSLWHQAKQFVDRRLTCDTFRDIFAKLIFLLTQRPSQDVEFENIRFNISPNNTKYLQPKTDISAASPPQGEPNPTGVPDNRRESIYVSHALKQMMHWKRRIFSGPNGRPCSAQALTVAEARSFQVMFWISIMADTTSAAMANIPFTMKDEECGLDFSIQAAHPMKRHRNDLTSLDRPTGRLPRPDSLLLVPGRSTPIFDLCKFHPGRWIGACGRLDLDEVERRLQNAVPLKVLQWRKVGALQNAVRANRGSGEIEQCIRDGLAVCEFWAGSYQGFFGDCLPHYGRLTFKLQSWFVLLGCHWHLACLRLAECIDAVDDAGLSSALQRALRRSSGLTLELRRTSAEAIAQLARVSHSDESAPDPSHADFCPLLKSSVLLTEPWTDLSIQAFATAGAVLSGWLAIWAAPPRSAAEMEDVRPEEIWVCTKTQRKQLEELCADTAQALNVIGLLSNTARSAARELSLKLEL